MNTNKKRMMLYLAIVIMTVAFVLPNMVFADPVLDSINKLDTLIFGIIRAVGLILTGFGIMQFGMSMKSHDPVQRSTGLLCILGGLIIVLAKEILNFITG